MNKLPLAALAASLLIAPSIHAAAITGQGTWESTLQGRDLDGNFQNGFEAYYDTTLNITWLADTDYGRTSGYDGDGIMRWDNANTWVSNLNPYGSGITGWRMPTTVDVGNNGATYTNLYQGVDYGYNITTHSELSHMFYVTLGNTPLYDTSGAFQTGYGFANSGPFANTQYWAYWSGTALGISPWNAWYFNFMVGQQSYASKDNDWYVWAVHAGDVGASSVPVPAAAWLFGSGLIGLIGFARHKSRT